MLQHEEDLTAPLLVDTFEPANDDSLEISEQNRYIAKIIQDFLGYMPKLGAKLPKSILAIGLFSAWALPIVFELGLERGSSDILMQLLSKTNINNLMQSLLLGAGCFTFYKSSQLYKESELAANPQNQHHSILAIRQTPSIVVQNLREQNVFLRANLIVMKQEKAALRQQLAEKDTILTEVLRRTAVSDITAPKVTVLRSFTAQDKDTSSSSSIDIVPTTATAATIEADHPEAVPAYR